MSKLVDGSQCEKMEPFWLFFGWADLLTQALRISMFSGGARFDHVALTMEAEGSFNSTALKALCAEPSISLRKTGYTSDSVLSWCDAWCEAALAASPPIPPSRPPCSSSAIASIFVTKSESIFEFQPGYMHSKTADRCWGALAVCAVVARASLLLHGADRALPGFHSRASTPLARPPTARNLAFCNPAGPGNTSPR